MFGPLEIAHLSRGLTCVYITMSAKCSLPYTYLFVYCMVLVISRSKNSLEVNGTTYMQALLDIRFHDYMS